jgi:hypothetical protein
MERIFNKAENFKKADEWDIRQQISMTPQERMESAYKLKIRVYGEATKDVRQWHRNE